MARLRLFVLATLFSVTSLGAVSWGDLSKAQLQKLQNYWAKNHEVAPACDKLNDEHQAAEPPAGTLAQWAR